MSHLGLSFIIYILPIHNIIPSYKGPSLLKWYTFPKTKKTKEKERKENLFGIFSFFKNK